MAETYTASTLPPMANWDKMHYVGMTKKQQDACPRVSIGYTDRWDQKKTVRVVPACMGWEMRVKDIFAQLANQGKTGIWFERWEPK